MTQSPHGQSGSVSTETPADDGNRAKNGPAHRSGRAPDRPTPSSDFGEPTITRLNSLDPPAPPASPPAGQRFGPGPASPSADVPNGPPPFAGMRTAPSPTGIPASPGAPPSLPPGGLPTPPTSRRDAARASGPRRARLQVRHVNPWTVLKFSCVVSVVLFFVWLIMIAVLYLVLDAAGVVGKINDTVTTINGTGSNAPITPGIVFGAAAIVGVVNIVLFIALTTIGSVVYNLCADLVGGVEVTLSERETV
jgi:Transmembrane domain of unknown function (DUF3566)